MAAGPDSTPVAGLGAFDAKGPQGFAVALKSVASGFGNMASKVSGINALNAALSKTDSLLSSIVGKLNKVPSGGSSRGAHFASSSSSGFGGTGVPNGGVQSGSNGVASPGGMGLPSVGAMDSFAASGASGSNPYGAYGISGNPIQSFSQMGMGGGGGSGFGNPGGYGTFSSGRLAVGAAVVGGGVLARVGSNLAAKGVGQAQVGSWLSTYRPGSWSQNYQYAQSASGFSANSVGDLSTAVQNINGSGGYGVGTFGYNRMLASSGALSNISKSIGTNLSLADTTSMQATLMSAQGRAQMMNMGITLAPQSTNSFSLAESLSRKLDSKLFHGGNGGMLSTKQIASQSTYGGGLYNALAQMGYKSNEIQTMTNYLARQQNAGGPGVVSLGTVQNAAQAQADMAKLKYGKSPAVMEQQATNIISAAGSPVSIASAQVHATAVMKAAEIIAKSTNDLGSVIEKWAGDIAGAVAATEKAIPGGSKTVTAAATYGATKLIPKLKNTNFGRAVRRVPSGEHYSSGSGSTGTHFRPTPGGTGSGGDAPAPGGGVSGGGVGPSTGGAGEGTNHPFAEAFYKSTAYSNKFYGRGPTSINSTGIWNPAGAQPMSGGIGGGTKPPPKQASSISGSTVVSDAEKFLGVPYVWGGTSPAGVDCSGLTTLVFKEVGVSLPRLAADQAKAGSPVNGLGSALPGDLVFFGGNGYDGSPSAPGHVGIYMGNGKMIDAPYTGTDVRIDNVGQPVAIRRILGSNGKGNVGAPLGGASKSTTGNTGLSGYTANPSGTAAGGALGEGSIGGSADLTMSSFSGGGYTSAATGGTQGNTGGIGGGSTGTTGGGAVGISGNLLSEIQAAERDTGVGANWTAGLQTIIQHESGGNASSVNNWDSNAAAGHPSQGLMQLIPSTFAGNVPKSLASKGILNPTANIAAGINYIKGRYGSINNVPGIASLARGGGYVGYMKGSQFIESDQVAQLHKGEMVIQAGTAAAMRMNQLSSGGEGSKISINIAQGALVYHAAPGGSSPSSGSSTSNDAKSMADEVFKALESRARISSLRSE